MRDGFFGMAGIKGIGYNLQGIGCFTHGGDDDQQLFFRKFTEYSGQAPYSFRTVDAGASEFENFHPETVFEPGAKIICPEQDRDNYVKNIGCLVIIPIVRILNVYYISMIRCI